MRSTKTELYVYDKSLHNQWLDILKLNYNYQMTSVQLFSCKIDDQNIEQLLKFRWHFLASLSLSNNRITDIGINKLMRMDWKGLKSLSLSGQLIGNQGIKIISKSELPNLEQLWLAKCNIGNSGVSHLIKPLWNRLCLLDIRFNTSITSSGMHYIANLSSWPKMHKLFIGKFTLCSHIEDSLLISLLNFAMHQSDNILVSQLVKGDKNIDLLIKNALESKFGLTGNNHQAYNEEQHLLQIQGID